MKNKLKEVILNGLNNGEKTVEVDNELVANAAGKQRGSPINNDEKTLRSIR